MFAYAASISVSQGPRLLGPLVSRCNPLKTGQVVFDIGVDLRKLREASFFSQTCRRTVRLLAQKSGAESPAYSSN